MSERKPSPIVKLGVMGIVALGLMQGYKATQTVQEYINSLPVEGQIATPDSNSGQPPKPKAVGVDKNLTPLLLESKAKLNQLSDSTAAASSGVRLDDVFGRKGTEKPADNAASAEAAQAASQPVVIPDFFLGVPTMVTVQALSSNGAIINEHWTDLGAKIRGADYYDKGGRLVSPILYAVDGKSVVLKEASGSRMVRVGLVRDSH